MFYHVFTYLKALSKSEKGQGAVEYGLIIALVSLFLIVALAVLKTPITGLVTKVTSFINGAPTPE